MGNFRLQDPVSLNETGISFASAISFAEGGQTVAIGTHDNGLFLSSDAGTTWQRVPGSRHKSAASCALRGESQISDFALIAQNYAVRVSEFVRNLPVNERRPFRERRLVLPRVLVAGEIVHQRVVHHDR